MSNDKVLDIIIARMDRIENKVDKLLEFKWKIAGMAIVVGVVGAAAFQLINTFIQAKGG